MLKLLQLNTPSRLTSVAHLGGLLFLGMSKQLYQKQPKSFEEQLRTLMSRNLAVLNRQKALQYLSQISYYRLSAYFLPYQKKKDQFDEGITFQQIIDTYSFDRELRLLVFDCIERIEVSIRTQFIYYMSMEYNDSHWQDKKIYFTEPYKNKIGRTVDVYSDFQKIITRAKKTRRPEVFIKHYINKYSKPANPPSWMCFELLTIGELSHIYRNLRNKKDKKQIARFFDLHPTVFTSWLHSITYVRNICAHHSRLWNKDLAIEPERLKKPKGPWLSDRFQNNSRVFYFVSTLKYLLLRANPENNLTEKLDSLFRKYSHIPIKYIGIPSDKNQNMLNWRNEALWRNE